MSFESPSPAASPAVMLNKSARSPKNLKLFSWARLSDGCPEGLRSLQYPALIFQLASISLLPSETQCFKLLRT